MPEASEPSFISRNSRLLFGVELARRVGWVATAWSGTLNVSSRIVNFEATIRDPPQARPTLKVMQKMAINCQQGHAAAQFRHHM